MSRFKGADAILDAAERWKRQCLLGGGSLFSEERLWTRERFEELRTHYVERPDEGDRSFSDKLRDQLDPASPEAKRLWAEITWLYYLIVNSVTQVTKHDKIRVVWKWSGAEFPEGHWALGDVLGQGIIHPGQSYLRHQWQEFRLIVVMMLDWWSRSAGERESLLGDPWRFAEWVDGQEGGSRRQFRHALLFLLFPDAFEPIMTLSRKRDIVKAFREETGEAADFDHSDLVGIDKALLAIRNRLQEERPGQEVDFYAPPFREVWRGDSQASDKDARSGRQSGERRGGSEDEDWYRDRFGAADTWLIAPGAGARLWGECLESGIVAIGWDDLEDLSEHESREAMQRALIESGMEGISSPSLLAVWQFGHEMKIGDVVLAKRGRRDILGWGLVTGDYAYDPERAEFRHVRTVEWHACHAPITLSRPFAMKTLTRITDRGWLRSVFASIDAGAEKPDIEPDGGEGEPYDLEAALSGLFVEEAQFRRILGSIALRKNLILQGPPGTGKTFIARRIAWCLNGRKDSRPIEVVQFHQSYAYEDFVQGWRPTDTGGFRLRDGVFFEFCKRAERQPKTPFVFIIDEINRGNLSKIFGELLMLIEADKRGGGHAIPLTYGEPSDRFSVPDNVHLLGLMNTADRSLAIVDYALRRRFAFETLKPAYRNEKFREFLLEAEVDAELVDRIDERLSELNEQIRNDKDLGAGFEIGHSYFVPEDAADEQWYASIVDTQIAPLLREYWFDRPKRADELIEKLRQ